MSVADAIEGILSAVRRDAGEATPADRILNSVLVDREKGSYETPIGMARIKELGIDLVDVPLVRQTCPPRVDPDGLSQLLVSLV